VHPGWLPAIEKSRELLREPLFAKRALIGKDDELEEIHVMEALCLLLRR
jgi:hypothetical protein